jgi:hypothetical protein
LKTIGPCTDRLEERRRDDRIAADREEPRPNRNRSENQGDPPDDPLDRMLGVCDGGFGS